MKYKLNSKGQGALEYLLIIGGVVLVAVIVVALLIGMSTDNSENAKKQTSEFISNTDIALPSTVLSVICKEKTAGPDEYVVKWNATHKDGYEYTLLFDDSPIKFEYLNILPSTNPIVFTRNDDKLYMETGASKIKENCSELGSEAISIRTLNLENNTTAVSNRVFIKPQAAVTPGGPGLQNSLSFNRGAGTLTITFNPDVDVSGSDYDDGVVLRFVGLTDSDDIRDFLNGNTSPYKFNPADIGLPSGGEMCEFLVNPSLQDVRLIKRNGESVIATINVANIVTIDCE